MIIQNRSVVRRSTRPLNRALVVGFGSGPRVWMEALEARRLFSVTMMAPGDGLPVVPQPANAMHDPQMDIVYIQWGSQTFPVVRGEWIIGIDVNAATWMQPPDMNESDWPGGDLYHTDRGMQAALDGLGAGYQFKSFLGVWDVAAIHVPDGVSYNDLEQTLSNLPGFTGEASPDGITTIADAPSNAAPSTAVKLVFASQPTHVKSTPANTPAQSNTSTPAPQSSPTVIAPTHSESLASSLLDTHDHDPLVGNSSASVLA